MLAFLASSHASEKKEESLIDYYLKPESKGQARRSEGYQGCLLKD